MVAGRWFALPDNLRDTVDGSVPEREGRREGGRKGGREGGRKGGARYKLDIQIEDIL